MFKWIERRKERKAYEEEFRKKIDDLIIKELENADNCSGADRRGDYIDNAKTLSEICNERDKLEVEKAKNLIGRIGIATDLATTGISVGAQMAAIRHADKLNTMGVIDTTEYGKQTKRNLFQLPLKK